VSFPRSSGILLHPTSLPGAHGIGDLGSVAFEFADFLTAAGQTIWQMLPLGPTGYGDSPYQCFSAFAGNPALISLDRLREQGLLAARDLENLPQLSADKVEYEKVNRLKSEALSKAFTQAQDVGFRQPSAGLSGSAFQQFKESEKSWLPEYALFRALKDKFGGIAWPKWERALASRQPEALSSARKELAQQIAEHEFFQFLFFEQWNALKAYCRSKNIRVMGDLPIYVSHDSADVWAHPEYFHLDASGNAEKVAGVPPDYFSSTGQLWGNPIYRWERMAADGYSWWVERFRGAFRMFDLLRVDHFRGFEAYWEVPGGEATAINGRWTKGPGGELFVAVEAKLGQLPILAENLGVITPEVEAIRERFGFPGMAILQFAFGTDPKGPDFRPHNYPRNRVAYTGTHDNDTTLGWWNTLGKLERKAVEAYVGSVQNHPAWPFIRAVEASPAQLAIVPAQDLLELGSEARMNTPAVADGNWRWRAPSGCWTEELADRLAAVADVTDRDNDPLGRK
jgi:4-alpha-glucanotransferase